MSKQYMMVVDELCMALLSRVMPGIKYVEVSSMDMASSTHQVLVVPKGNKDSGNDPQVEGNPSE